MTREHTATSVFSAEQDSAAVKVIDVVRARLDEAAEVLARAFADYPVLRYIFPRGEADRQSVFQTFRFICGARMENGEPVKGIVRGGRLVGAACLNEPDRKPWPEAIERAFADFAERAGDGVLERFERYAELSEAHRPSEPHYYLIVLGVLPEVQGQGYGRMLLDEAHAMSAAHPLSQGVGLDTETTANVALYRHCGYRTTAHVTLEEVPVWSMFRPDDAPYTMR